MDNPSLSRLFRGVGVRTAARRFLIWSTAVTVLSCLINIGGINGSAVIDDHYLLQNKMDARGCGLNPIVCFSRPQFGLYYRPVMGASFSAGEVLHGQGPFAFHVENLILHAFVVLEACAAFRLLFHRDRPALLASLLYAVHPLQVSVTTFIGGRTDSLALLFLFAYVIATLRIRHSRAPSARIALSLAAYTGAVFCKEQCMPLILLLPLLVHAGSNSGPEERARNGPPPYWMGLYLIPIATYLISASRVIPRGAIDTVAWSATRTQVGWDLGLRIEMIGRTLCYFAQAMCWPTQAVIHQSSLGAWDSPRLLAALFGFFAAGIGVAVLRHTWGNPALRILCLWTILTMAPCLNIVPIPSQFAACYRAVIPLFGIAGLCGALCDALAHEESTRGWHTFALAVPLVLTMVMASLSLADVPLWRTDSAITFAQYKADPNFLPALSGYATSLRREGRRREAIAVNNQVMDRLFPTQHTLEERMAVIDSPWMLRAVKSQSSLRYQPRAFVLYVMRERGGGYQELGMYAEAIEDYRLALAVQPDDDEVADAYVYCCDASGRTVESRAMLEALAATAPTSVRLKRLGAAYIRERRWGKAQAVLAKAKTMATQERSAEIGTIESLFRQAESSEKRERLRPATGDRSG